MDQPNQELSGLASRTLAVKIAMTAASIGKRYFPTELNH
jgi:hypothetical protein